MEKNGTLIDTRLESKLGFDRIRTIISNRCSTDYATGRVADETFSSNPKEILKRLSLTDEMRLIVMFEEGFPTNGYIDCLDFLRPLEQVGCTIDLLSLGKLRTLIETVRKLTRFFAEIKDGVYPNLKRMAAPVMSFPEVQRRINLILDRFGDVKDSASDKLQQIRRSLAAKESAISKRANAILKQARMDGLVDEDASLTVRDGKLLIPVNASNKKKSRVLSMTPPRPERPLLSNRSKSSNWRTRSPRCRPRKPRKSSIFLRNSAILSGPMFRI
ncbi:MAG: hypothetical protein QM324_05890 [Bacteroidota bacterium]|nr:hypothetical protein [Bacteroidota bacterium]